MRYLLLLSAIVVAPMAQAQQPANAIALQQPGKYSFDSNGVKIHYQIKGAGEPVLLIHGFSSSSRLDWWRMTPALAKSYMVIAMDCRGHGKSEKPHAPANYGNEMAFDAIRLLDHLQIEKAHIVGFSMGGFITGKLLVLHPERIRSATIAGAGWLDIDGPWGANLDEIAESLEAGNGVMPLLDHLQPTSGRRMSRPKMFVIDRILVTINDRWALAQVARGLKQLAVPRDELKSVAVPVLAIIGEEDPLKEAVDALQGAIPDLRTVVLEDHEHIDTPFSRGCVAATKAFLDEQPR